MAAFHININGHWDIIPIAIKTPLFYVAFLFSVVTCYLLLWIIRKLNKVLEEKFPWELSASKRLILQLSLTFMLPALVDLCVLFVYFAATGRLASFKLYINYDFPTVLLFILAADIGYLLSSIYQYAKDKSDRSEYLIIRYNGEYIKLQVRKDILFFIRDKKLVKVFTTNGGIIPFKDSLSNLIKSYGDKGLCQINPSVIINISLLHGYKVGTNRDTLIPSFKPAYAELVKQTDQMKIRVTKEYKVKFREMIDKYQFHS